MNRREAIKALRESSLKLHEAEKSFKAGRMRWPDFIRVSTGVQRLRIRCNEALTRPVTTI